MYSYPGGASLEYSQVIGHRQRVERLSAENDTLRRQVERLDVLVTRLADYYGTSTAASPRGLRI